MIELDHLNIDLAGVNLIEASAGTGKTYAIAGLYLRLLIEKDLLPEQILVVTFTEAATKELRSRIRGRIRKAIAVADGESSEDTFIKDLLNNVNGRGPGGKVVRQKLDRALNAFDTASIFTIHGFCLGAIKENAFESGSLYDTELITDQKEYLQEVVDDFWRSRFFNESAPLLKYALDKGFSPAGFVEFLAGMLSNPKLEIIPAYRREEIAAMEENCRLAFAELRLIWQDSRDEIEEIIRNDKGLSRDMKFYRSDLLPGLFAEMDSFAAGDDPFHLFPTFEKFTVTGLAKGTKASGKTPTHQFFSCCETLLCHVGQRILALHWELITFCRERLAEKKKETNIRFYEDLLNDLYLALSGENGAALAGRLRERYQAALIDEFQDTDPVQYDIFRKIFGVTDHPLFLIGDPKQSIYSFRGADIFAYLQASEDVTAARRFTLTANWRSTPGLLEAFNIIFGSITRPFVFDRIVYHPVKPGKSQADELLDTADSDQAPFRIWYLPGEEQGKPIKVTRAHEIIPPAVAAEIFRLLERGKAGKATIGGRPLVPGDIAVIVRFHRQADYILEALRQRGIPAVVKSDKSVFAGEEAKELCTLLSALADPGNETKVRAALVTGIIGRSGDDIARLLDDEAGWEDCLESFRAYHQTWRRRGFMVMALSLLAGEGIRGRLLRRIDGERCLTNLLHCLEILHRTEQGQKLGMEGLVTWFRERVSVEEEGEEYEIRLETDEKAVQILTVHAGKGLEYPVVFCPFLWGGVKETGRVTTFHDNFRMVKDFGSPGMDRNRIRARTEELAENLRLLYVAVTRAKYRCYLCTGNITRKGEPEASSLAYMFHSSEGTRMSHDPVGELAREIKTMSEKTMRDQLQALREKASEVISIAPLPEADVAGRYAPVRDDGEIRSGKRFTGAVVRDWRVASFSSFAAGEEPAGELPDRDEIGTGDAGGEERNIERTEDGTIFTFPRGTQAGIFFHEIFEKLNYAAPSREAVGSLVEKTMAKHGYDRTWFPAVCAMVNDVLATELSTPTGICTLGGLAPGSWVPELEFFLPLKYITAPRLGDCMRNWGVSWEAADMKRICSTLKFQPVRGMLRGFMDLVFEQEGRFYILDWKSNHLGYRPEDYGREAIREEMIRHLYPLQYLLYTVALHRFLSLRVRGYDYATHFGGVIYVFLRGVGTRRSEEFGFFRDNPPRDLIEAMTEILVHVEEKGGGNGL